MEQASIQETTFCDFNHPAISSLAKKLANGETNTRKITQSVFKHVRDNIRFGFDIVQVKTRKSPVPLLLRSPRFCMWGQKKSAVPQTC